MGLREYLNNWSMVGAALTLGTAILGGPSAEARIPLQSTVEIDRPKVVVGYDGPIYVLVDLEAVEIEVTGDARPDLNLGLVLDRSGSMSDAGKIEYLKRASSLAIDQLLPADRLGVVEYDDEINVLWPSGPLESPGTIKKLIQGLEPRGSTNLTGGMMQGVAEVMTSLNRIKDSQAVVSRVLLLSDGLANFGVTDPSRIGEMVREARRKGVRVSTLGLGRDYDEDLMQLIAENGGGHYYYIENPDQMARIFKEELMTMLETVARNTQVSVKHGNLVDAVEAISIGSKLLTSEDEVDLGDFYSGEKRTVVLRLQPDDDAFDTVGKVSLAEIKLSFMDAKSGKAEKISFPVKVDVVRAQKHADAAINSRVIVETMLLETEREHEQAVKLYEKGQYEAADVALASLAGKMDQVSMQYDDIRLNQKAEALRVEQNQMKEVAATPEASADYLKKSKQRLFKARKGSRSLYSLEEGNKGLNVERLQKALTDSGDYTGPVDGLFSDDVTAALTAYQKREGLNVDGIAGPATLSRLGLY
jgi:Ca-activated chloride channel homolog